MNEQTPPLPQLTPKPTRPVAIQVIALVVFFVCVGVFYLTVTGRVLPGKGMVFALSALLVTLALIALFIRCWQAFSRASGTAVTISLTKWGTNE